MTQEREMDASALAIIFTVLVGDFILPIYVAVRAWRKGYREWTWATLAGVIVLFLIANILPKDAPSFLAFATLLIPPVISTIAWVKTKEPLAIPIECSKCGEPSRAIRRVTLDPATGKKIHSKSAGMFWLISGLACLILFLWLLVNGIGTIAPALILVFFMIRTGFNILRDPAIPIKKIEYKCTACGRVFIPGRKSQVTFSPSIICPACGKEVRSDNLYCNHCGVKVLKL